MINKNALENLILNAKQDTFATSKWIKGKSISATDKKCFINSCKNLGHLTQNVILSTFSNITYFSET